MIVWQRVGSNIHWGLCVLLWIALIPHAISDTNFAAQCEIRSTPYVGATISYLVDGIINSAEENTLMMSAPLPLRARGVLPLQYEFSFPKPLPVTSVRLFQYETKGRRPATHFIIDLDTKGTGVYDKIIVSETRGRGGKWLRYDFPQPVSANALRFRTTGFGKDAGPNYGSPAIGEFEIYTSSAVPPTLSFPLSKAPMLEVDMAKAKAIKSSIQNSDAPWNDQFHRGMMGSMWLYWSAGRAYSERENRRKIQQLKSLRVNRYWLYPGVYVPNGVDRSLMTMPKEPDNLYFVNRQLQLKNKDVRIVPFPSLVVPGYKENVLGQFVDHFHKNNIGVIVNEQLLPYGLSGWDFPRVMNAKEYPCVLSSPFVHRASTDLYREYMQAGADGLVLGGDEFFVHGHTGMDEASSAICQNSVDGRDNCRPSCKDIFKKKYGDKPGVFTSGFSEQSAKWEVFEYEQLADLFANYAAMMKGINANAVVTSLFQVQEGNRPGYGVAYDVMGTRGKVSEMSSNPYWSHDSYLGHYYFANETKKLIGASEQRMAAVTLQTTPNFDKNGYPDPIMVYGPAFSSLMHGVKGINFYKQDYLFAGGKNDAGPWVEKVFGLTAYLEQKGLLDYQAPKKVAMLYSRASEDWWQLAHQQDPVVAAEGILYQNAVMEVLFRSAVPFDLYYLDQPTLLDKLGKYSIIILPYPYSVSGSAMAQIRKAATQGAKVIALERKGEVDEFGARNSTPALYGIAGLDYLKVDVSRTNYTSFSGRILQAIQRNFPDGLPMAFDAGGKDVECSILGNGLKRLVFCLNWEKSDVVVNLGLNLVNQDYSVSAITLDHDVPALLNGRKRISALDLKAFALNLTAGEAKILSVMPASAPAMAPMGELLQ